jgi:hypothetical protein
MGTAAEKHLVNCNECVQASEPRTTTRLCRVNASEGSVRAIKERHTSLSATQMRKAPSSSTLIK